MFTTKDPGKIAEQQLKESLTAHESNKDFAIASFGKVLISNGFEQYIHLLNLIRVLRAIFGDEPLKNKYGSEFPKIIKIIQSANIKAHIIEAYLRGIRAQTINAEDLKSERFQEYLNAAAELALINQTLFDVTFFLVNHSNITDIPFSNIVRSAIQKELETLKLLFDTEKEQTFIKHHSRRFEARE